MAYSGPERRKHPRIDGRFVVSYRLAEDMDSVDCSQTRNLSLGGMLLTTNKPFRPGAKLILEIMLPFDPDPIVIFAEVLESREVTKGLIYDTRLKFFKIDQGHIKAIGSTVEYYLKKGK